METRQPDWVSDDGSVRLYCGDCLQILPELEAGSVDGVIADIPYAEVNRASGGLRSLDKGAADAQTFSALFAAQQAARIAAGTVYLWCGVGQISDIRNTLAAEGLTVRLGAWHKTNPSPMNGDRLWLSALEACVFGRKPHAYFSRHCQTALWKGPSRRESDHPTPKPTWLMQEQVDASIPEGGTVLDFCMGSGTTGVACVRTGRKFVGIELEPKYFEIAKARIQKALAEKASLLPLCAHPAPSGE